MMTKSDLQALGAYYALMDIALQLVRASIINMSEYQLIEQKAAAEAHLPKTSIYREKWREPLDLSGV